MKKIMLLRLLCLLPFALFAQPSVPLQREAMKKLDYMIGAWKGAGWMERDGQRHTFAGSETVQSKLGGLALLVEGKFKGTVAGVEQEVTVHETLAVMSYDEQAKIYRFRTYLANGNAGDHELKLLEGGWQWGLEFPGGKIRYTLQLRATGE